jgi:hypothetical protein
MRLSSNASKEGKRSWYASKEGTIEQDPCVCAAFMELFAVESELFDAEKAYQYEEVLQFRRMIVYTDYELSNSQS